MGRQRGGGVGIEPIEELADHSDHHVVGCFLKQADSKFGCMGEALCIPDQMLSEGKKRAASIFIKSQMDIEMLQERFVNFSGGGVFSRKDPGVSQRASSHHDA